MTSSDLSGLCPGPLAAYLMGSRRLMLVVVDRHGAVCAANAGFTSFVGLQRLAPGTPLSSFLAAEAPGLPADGQAQDRQLTLSLRAADGGTHPLQARAFNHGDRTIIIGETPQPSESQIITEMSAVAADLTNVTRELKRKNQELERARAEIDRLARTDELTGLANRREFMAEFDTALPYAIRHNAPLSVVLCDLDHFKQVNDTQGHSQGDAALQFFAGATRCECRAEDVVARYGGEEFVILLRGTDARGAEALAERIRHRLEQESEGELGFALTASFGVTELKGREDAEVLMARADAALYAAKDAGRNTVRAAQAEPSGTTT